MVNRVKTANDDRLNQMGLQIALLQRNIQDLRTFQQNFILRASKVFERFRSTNTDALVKACEEIGEKSTKNYRGRAGEMGPI